MAFRDLDIHNASMEGLSTSLELPPELLKPLVVKGVNYALPVRCLCGLHMSCWRFYAPSVLMAVMFK